MKKIIFSLGLVAIIGFAGHASADTKCGNPALSDANTTYTNCDGGSPEMVVGGWGTTNSAVPHVKGGDTVVDEGGVVNICPASIAICVDLTHTAWYRTQMLTLGKQLKDFGITGGRFSYWINLAK